MIVSDYGDTDMGPETREELEQFSAQVRVDDSDICLCSN